MVSIGSDEEVGVGEESYDFIYDLKRRNAMRMAREPKAIIDVGRCDPHRCVRRNSVLSKNFAGGPPGSASSSVTRPNMGISCSLLFIRSAHAKYTR